MNALKKAWITACATTDRLLTLSLESAEVDPEYRRLGTSGMVFPDRETGGPRHVTTLWNLTEADLILLHQTVGAFLARRQTQRNDRVE
jgi:hypothetical protein